MGHIMESTLGLGRMKHSSNSDIRSIKKVDKNPTSTKEVNRSGGQKEVEIANIWISRFRPQRQLKSCNHL